MANKVESIVEKLGKLRNGLIEQGFSSDQAFWMTQDLVRVDVHELLYVNQDDE